MSRRWIVERKATNYDNDDLKVIEVYKVGENKELVKQENKIWTHKRKLITL